MDTFTRMAEEWIRQQGTETAKRETRQPAAPDPDRTTSLAVCSREVPRCDPTVWLPEFFAWVRSQCFFRDRCFGGIGSLHVHFSEWCFQSGSVPCSRQTFEWILRDQDFLIANGLVSGLILAADETVWQEAITRARRDCRSRQ